MSAPRSYVVRLFIGRTLTRCIDADSADAAEIIARYLFGAYNADEFRLEGDEIFDIEVTGPDGEEGR